jgi:hypothetical protein
VDRFWIEVISMAHRIALTADVLGTDQDDPQVVGDNATVSDAGRPGVVPGTVGHANEVFGAAGSEAEPKRREPSEVITEVAPEVAPSEVKPEYPEPSEVITEVAPEVAPSETKHERPEPSEVITEVAPERPGPIVEVAPERPIVEVAPEHPEHPEPSEVIPEVAPERPEQD